jgi:type IV pilus assembly protein PilM
VTKISSQSLLYRDKPLFGLDIGFSTMKAMQVDLQTNVTDTKSKIVGYGVNEFDSDIIEDGVIKDYKALAGAANQLFTSQLQGQINTKRVVATIPAAKVYSRVINQPANLSKADLNEAVNLEAAQYIPIPLEDLYIDYSITGKNDQEIDILLVGAPKKIVDSYINFFELIGLELCALETTISAASRIVSRVENSNDIPTILIDLGSLSVDLTVFDKNLVINGTIPGGGDNISKSIADKLKISKAEADNIKTKYGLGVSKYQSDIRSALTPLLDSLTKEIRRVVRYYEEKTSHKETIGQIITMGGGSNMPGLVDYLTDNLRIPTRLCDFWGKFDASGLELPVEAEKSLYITVAGAAIVKPSEIWL